MRIADMKKIMVAFLLLALLTMETSCVVRVKERRRPVPERVPAHGGVY